MLVLSRAVEEAIVIDGGRIVVKVVEIRGNTVRLGFAADKAVPIHRQEVFELIQGQKLAEKVPQL